MIQYFPTLRTAQQARLPEYLRNHFQDPEDSNEPRIRLYSKGWAIQKGAFGEYLTTDEYQQENLK
jgi:hypothetical protein